MIDDWCCTGYDTGDSTNIVGQVWLTDESGNFITDQNGWRIMVAGTVANRTLNAVIASGEYPQLIPGSLGFEPNIRAPNPKGVNYSFALTDLITCVRCSVGALNFTILNSGTIAWPDQATLMLENVSSANINLVRDAGVAFVGAGLADANRVLAVNGTLFAKYITGNFWLVTGFGVT